MSLRSGTAPTSPNTSNSFSAKPRKRRVRKARAPAPPDPVVSAEPPGKLSPKEEVARLAKKLKKVKRIDQLLSVFKVRQWNYVIVGDGSAMTRKDTAGWGSVTFDQREPYIPRPLYGGLSHGTNIMAEMLSFAFALERISGDKARPAGVIHVHLFTDCEYVVKASGQEGPVRRKAHRELWAMVDAFRRTGIMCHWHWVPRDCFDLNRFCHDVANAARLAMKGVAKETVEKYEGKLR